MSPLKKHVIREVCCKCEHLVVKQCDEVDCEHAIVTGGEWRLKYERAIREIEFTKKRLQQEFDDKLEVEQQNKRQLERRVRLPLIIHH